MHLFFDIQSLKSWAITNQIWFRFQEVCVYTICHHLSNVLVELGVFVDFWKLGWCEARQSIFFIFCCDVNWDHYHSFCSCAKDLCVSKKKFSNAFVSSILFRCLTGKLQLFHNLELRLAFNIQKLNHSGTCFLRNPFVRGCPCLQSFDRIN